ncbi:MAG: NAD(P)/FAD-dependent oxidoreductase [Chloroflexi bacterium]|nr:NAD(P)/FAD-dependent oxidoreductase [Chloroflexota bacterium]
MPATRRGVTILILGGGIGGIAAARALRGQLSSEHRIVLVERADSFTYSATSFWILTGRRQPADLTRPYDRLARHAVTVHKAEVKGLDLERRTVQTTVGDLSYDYLIVALGAELHMEAIPGLPDAGFNLYQAADLVRLRDALASFPGGRLVLTISRLPFKCPAAPYEAALTLDALLRERGLRHRTRIELYTPEAMPIAIAGPRAAAHLTDYLRARGIVLYTNHLLRAAHGEKRQLTFQDSITAEYDLLVAVPPHSAPAVLRQSALGGEGGWVPADCRTLATRVEDVYALGDAASVTLPSGRPLPKAGVFARGAAEVVAHNIAVLVRGRGHQKPYVALGGCHLETGDGHAFSIVGDFSAAPQPMVELQGPSRAHHWGKVHFERMTLNQL